jgi:hypothetical protein
MDLCERLALDGVAVDCVLTIPGVAGASPAPAIGKKAAQRLAQRARVDSDASPEPLHS